MKVFFLGFILALTLPFIPANASEITDQQIRQAMIQASIQSYPGNCPCPYNTDRAGRSCGKRSAYSKPGGYTPLCYAEDISDAEVEAFRKENNK